mmetsp:Transcript_21209/g.49132  ORF Transcript_21209/g.49132 Transcript_21209/m.49132 type:complete len:203 (-) Transcript_21209:643-1251(-)
MRAKRGMWCDSTRPTAPAAGALSECLRRTAEYTKKGTSPAAASGADSAKRRFGPPTTLEACTACSLRAAEKAEASSSMNMPEANSPAVLAAKSSGMGGTSASALPPASVPLPPPSTLPSQPHSPSPSWEGSAMASAGGGCSTPVSHTMTKQAIANRARDRMACASLPLRSADPDSVSRSMMQSRKRMTSTYSSIIVTAGPHK